MKFLFTESYMKPSTGNLNPPKQGLSRFSQSGPPSDTGPDYGRRSNRPQESYMEPSTGNLNPPKQQNSRFSQSGPPSDTEPDDEQNSNKPKAFLLGDLLSKLRTSGAPPDSETEESNMEPSTGNLNPPKQRISRFSQSGPPSDTGPDYGQNSNRPQGRSSGPSAASTDAAQQRMSGSQFSQPRSLDSRLAFGQTSNRPQDNYTNPSAASSGPAQQRKSGSQFSQPGPAFGQSSNRPQEAFSRHPSNH
ncbi:uncharacterized protein PAF06_018604 [Gastrophryne carolinensis]